MKRDVVKNWYEDLRPPFDSVLDSVLSRAADAFVTVAVTKIIGMIAEATAIQTHEMWKKLNSNEDSPSYMSSHITRQQYLNVQLFCITHGSTTLPSDFSI